MNCRITNSINAFVRHNIHEKLCVSLSGGVDSMVLLHALKMYQNRTRNFKTVNHFKLCAVHINYNNRDTCNEEVKFVECFCKSLDIPIEIRHITEMTRQRDHTRHDYEEITRNIRFLMYKQQECPILLGHNYEDTIENLISNIASKRKYSNLKGMTDESIEREVLILRPLLDVSKKNIYNYAKTHQIQHLPDSTPKWSRRGKLRDHIIPILETYEPNFIKGLENLATILKQYHEDTTKQFCTHSLKQELVALHQENPAQPLHP
jgi:tRNA(Ile)-lysidine synthetase-like protein